ncbi:uncharacterized protein [Clytia hemisphaerica]|uniref:uncharacterized protein isoform X1 n=1 Tax=Clytia hemisphaerica TaxID=252671 RepID=UPI0034D566E4
MATNIVFIGNPGVGKSTLLNCLVGKAVFKSGVSIVKGLSYQLQIETVKGIRYCDTPGLADMEMQKQAGKEITRALKQSGNFIIAFVITLEGGRVKPGDISTIEAVLEGAPDITSFGLVVNKLSTSLYKRLSYENRETVIQKVTQNLRIRNPAVHFLRNYDRLYEKSNVCMDIPTLNNFVFNQVTPVCISRFRVDVVSPSSRYNANGRRELDDLQTRIDSEKTRMQRKLHKQRQKQEDVLSMMVRYEDLCRQLGNVEKIKAQKWRQWKLEKMERLYVLKLETILNEEVYDSLSFASSPSTKSLRRRIKRINQKILAYELIEQDETLTKLNIKYHYKKKAERIQRELEDLKELMSPSTSSSSDDEDVFTSTSSTSSSSTSSSDDGDFFTAMIILFAWAIFIIIEIFPFIINFITVVFKVVVCFIVGIAFAVIFRQ